MADLPNQDTPVRDAHLREASAYQGAIAQLVTKLLQLKHLPENRTVIDYGAGHGDVASALVDDHDLAITCIESDRRIPQNYSHRLPRFSDLKWTKDRWAHAAYSVHFFQYVHRDAEALVSLVEKLKPGAYIFILVPAHPKLWSAMDSASGHVRRYTPARLQQLVASAGLTLEAQGWFDRLGYLSTRLRNLVFRGNPKPPSKLAVRCYDLAFRILEPALKRLPVGRSCWVLARAPKTWEAPQACGSTK